MLVTSAAVEPVRLRCDLPCRDRASTSSRAARSRSSASARSSPLPRSAATSCWSIPRLSTTAVKFAVDAGILLVSLVSIADPPSLHAAICAGGRRRGNREAAGLRARQLRHHLGVDRRACVADDGRQCRADLCAGPAAVVGTADRICRPQQRHLFHQMVSANIARRSMARRPPTRCPERTDALACETRLNQGDRR